jgi:ApaG protein
MSDTTTRGVRVIVRPEYLPEQSRPEADRWLFAYHVVICNEGREAVQLVNRHWVITNGEGVTDEVRGAGVIGQQPALEPGAEFHYTSGCPLDTPVGTMHGSYEMCVLATGETFEAHIAPFRLAMPTAVN